MQQLFSRLQPSNPLVLQYASLECLVDVLDSTPALIVKWQKEIFEYIFAQIAVPQNKLFYKLLQLIEMISEKQPAVMDQYIVKIHELLDQLIASKELSDNQKLKIKVLITMEILNSYSSEALFAATYPIFMKNFVQLAEHINLADLGQYDRESLALIRVCQLLTMNCFKANFKALPEKPFPHMLAILQYQIETLNKQFYIDTLELPLCDFNWKKKNVVGQMFREYLKKENGTYFKCVRVSSDLSDFILFYQKKFKYVTVYIQQLQKYRDLMNPLQLDLL